MNHLQNRPRLRKFIVQAGILLAAGVLLFGLVRLILGGYSAPWTGFADYEPPNSDSVRGKTLWDWMELLIIPLVLTGGAFFLQRSERTVERQVAERRTNEDRKLAEDRAKLEHELATDRQQEAALQAYLDRMAELLLKAKLGESEDERVLKVKRVRTLTVIRGLNAARNGIVLRFLRDVGLVGKLETTLFVNANLEGADLEGVDFSETNLRGANLKGANLSGANLYRANLSGAGLEAANLKRAYLYEATLIGAYIQKANLEGANLERAALSTAYLNDANLRNAKLENVKLKFAVLLDAKLEGANLEGAEVSNEQLERAQSLEGAIMPDGTRHD